MRALRVLSLIAVLVVGLTAPAEAHIASYETRVSVSQSAVNAYVGGYIRAAEICMKNRLVKLFRVTGDEPEYVGEDRTDEEGDWLVSFPAQIGQSYFAKATRRVRRGGEHICRSAMSENYTA